MYTNPVDDIQSLCHDLPWNWVELRLECDMNVIYKLETCMEHIITTENGMAIWLESKILDKLKSWPRLIWINLIGHRSVCPSNSCWDIQVQNQSDGAANRQTELVSKLHC